MQCERDGTITASARTQTTLQHAARITTLVKFMATALKTINNQEIKSEDH